MVKINRVDYSYNLYNNGSRINTLPLTAEPDIISYLAHLARKERVEQIHFLLAQHTIKACIIPKNFGDVTKLLADIQSLSLVLKS